MPETVQRLYNGSLTGTPAVSDMATIYGCCGLFDLCGDSDLMTLSFEGTNKFLDWIGWEATSVCEIKKNFITWTRPEPTGAGARSTGYITDPCGDSNGVDWGGCDFTLTKFGVIRRHGPVRDATQVGLRLCDIQPRYRLDGSPIRDDAEFDMRLATEGMLQDLKYMVINGTKQTGGMFDGLQALIKTGYTNSQGKKCKIMDANIINWNHNFMNGGSGVTWNGGAIAATYNFVDVLLAVVRRIKDRIDMAPALSSTGVSVGDIILVGPSMLLRCLLDSFTCWSVCEGVAYNPVVLQTYEARQFRNSLNGGMFGAGRIYLDGFEIPLMAYDWQTMSGPTSGDLYLLTGQVGSVKLISGQYNDLKPTVAAYPEANYAYTDGGKFLTWVNRINTCVQRETEFQPRILMWAPWAQARFEAVKCNQPGGYISPDPWETSFYPETSFNPAYCPTDRLDLDDGDIRHGKVPQ